MKRTAKIIILLFQENRFEMKYRPASEASKIRLIV